jgi:predicted  nucleic acid-binding Zn-ribbon protein
MDLESDFDVKDIEILKKMKELDDNLLQIRGAQICLDIKNSDTKDKILNIDNHVVNTKKEIDIFNRKIEELKANTLLCKKTENDLLVSKEKIHKDEHKTKIKEDIEIERLKIKLNDNKIEEIKIQITEKEKLLDKLDREKNFYLENNNTGEQQNITSKITDINLSRRKLLSMLSATTQKEYNDLFSFDKQKKAVTNIINGFCDCCHLQTTLQQQEYVLRNDTLVKCEYCGCFLVNNENNIK